MGWFDEQIKERKLHDEEMFEDAFLGIAGAVLGNKVTASLKDESLVSKDAIDEILKFYHIKSQEIPNNIKNVNEQLEFLLRPHGIMRRNVNLEKGWYKDAFGAMLGIRKDNGSVVALVPTGISGYSYFDVESKKRIRINKKNEDLFETQAIAFYSPFPLKKLSILDLVKYIIGILSPADYIMIIAATLAVSLVGMLTPRIQNILFGEVLSSGNIRVLNAIAIFLMCVVISSMLLTSVKSLMLSRINTKINITVEAAAMMRVLSLPADFFKEFSAGELSQRVFYVNSLCSMLVDNVLQIGLSSVFSLVYITQIFNYAPKLVIPSLYIIIITVLFSVLSTMIQMKISKKQMELSGKESGMSFALISGIQKIRLAGAEKRAFAKWGSLYAKQAELIYNPPVFLKINGVISLAISLIGTIIMYYMAIKSQISVADYYAFNTSYGMISGAFMSLAEIALVVAQIKPILEMVSPILSALPEVSEGKQVVTRLSGGIELNNVSFRYNENMPLVIDDLSLKIKPGQYVAIVGRTGCGKSTLVRLLLGFEKPQKGAIYYDGKDINTMDLKSLRQKIGVVMQDGKLFQGDIFSNISISAPFLTMDEAWEAARLAGLEEDIKAMPMGMYTLISEGGGGISGGQRQRMMIARAIAPKPKILMFDEATSALDNITQKMVAESLDSLKCTRIVIAHRLSTIKQCDRIIVLDNGKIIEDGTYDELIAENGFFAELIARQRINESD